MDGPAVQVLLLKFCSPEDQSLPKNLYLYHVLPESVHVNGSLYFTTPPSFALEMYSCCGCWWWDKYPVDYQGWPHHPQVSLPLPCTGSKEPKLALRGQPSSLPGQPISNGSLQSCRTHRHFWVQKHRNICRKWQILTLFLQLLLLWYSWILLQSTFAGRNSISTNHINHSSMIHWHTPKTSSLVLKCFQIHDCNSTMGSGNAQAELYCVM